MYLSLIFYFALLHPLLSDARPPVCATPKTILITGASSGVGLHLAKTLAQQGHTVVMAGRSKQIYFLVDEIKAATKNSQVFCLELDLSSLSSVLEFHKRYIGQFSKLDVLVLNAGTTTNVLGFSADGFELTFATNYLGHFYLTERFLASKQYTPSRIIVVGSKTHDPTVGPTIGGTPVYNLEDWAYAEKNFDGLRAYTQSKLAATMYGLELSRRLQNSTVINYSPGFIPETRLFRHFGFLEPVFKYLNQAMLSIKSWIFGVPDQSSSLERTVPFLARLAVGPEHAQSNGKYFSIDEESSASMLAQEVEKQDELVEQSRKWIEGLNFSFQEHENESRKNV
jgi:NAD(P)-dependent dehydrogenase (short-subunit alcohol dehydrogenase family)